MVNTRVGALLVAIGCGLIPLADSRGEEQPPIVDEKVVSKFVDYLAEHGIRLAKIPSGSPAVPPRGGYEAGQWVVAEPRSAGYEVVVYFRTFPPGTDEQAMRESLGSIALAGMVCAPARPAMSKPGLRGTGKEKLPRLEDVPVAAKLERLFKEYKPVSK